MEFHHSDLSKEDLNKGLKLFSKVDYNKTTYEELTNEIRILEKMKFVYWDLYQAYKTRLEIATATLQERCDHDFVVDRNNFEVDRTSFICRKCGK
jgi:hypothetical protein